jgi:thiamine phosphate synthase YjbQ (UPF0047 family)
MTINEGWDPDVIKDALCHLRHLVPQAADWAHAD